MRHRSIQGWGVAGACALALTLCACAGIAQGTAAVEGKQMRFTVDLDFGADIGQNYGSLFEAGTPDGKLTVGAGFMGVYNTRFRTDRHTVHLFVRPNGAERAVTLERLPRPSEEAGTYMFDLDGKLYASSRGADAAMRPWNPQTGAWEDPTEPVSRRMRVGNGILLMGSNQVTYDGEVILGPPERGSYGLMYYANGYLCYYHQFAGTGSGYREYESDDAGFSRLYAVPWSPAAGGAADMSKAITLTLPQVGETTFAWGQFGDQVMTGSNLGGFYVLDGGEWKTLRPPQIGVSFQIYSMLNYYDRVLMGQYPTGRLFEYDGKEMRELADAPPVMAGVSPSARELQTTAIYGGDVYAGVWPWGEVWRYNPDAETWTFVDRMFTHPEASNVTVHPYEKECTALEIVLNQWGQRVTSLVPLGDRLMVSTSAKGPCPYDERLTVLGNDRWKEYGAVIALHAAGNLSVPITYTGAPTRLEFIIGGGKLRILQDGSELASTALEGDLAGLVAGAEALSPITWGKGVFGDFRGAGVSGRVEYSQ